MAVRLNGSTSGYTELDAGVSPGNNTIKLPTANGNAYQVLRNGATAGTTEFADNIVSGTAVASTSGTSIDFTGIPSWVKKITVMLSGVSTSGTSPVQVQLGTSSGVIATGYAVSASRTGGGADLTGTTATAGFQLCDSASAALVRSGGFNFSLLDASVGRWVGFGTYAYTGTQSCGQTAGTVTLSGTLDRIRITTVNGTDAFDAGTVNILYE